MTIETRPDAALFVTGWWPNKSNPHDGVFVREHALAVQLQIPVVVIHLSLIKRAWRPTKTAWHEENDEGMTVLYGEIRTPIRRGGLHDLLVRKAYLSAIKKLSERYRFQFMHIHIRTPITEIAPQVGKELGLPSLVTEHSSFYHLWINHLSQEQKRISKERILRWFGQDSMRAVLPVSHDLAEVLRKQFGVAKEKIHVVPNVASPLFRKRPDLGRPPFRIVLAARWSAPKDPTLFIDALAKLPADVLAQLRVDWVGDGDQYEQVKVACKNLVERDIVRFTGRLQKSDLAHLLGEAHLLVHPTKAENLPCIIIESLCSGTPVLSNAVNGIPELIDASNGILCPPEDPEFFALALQQIMETYDKFDRDKIASAAGQRYSSERIASQLLAIYDQVVR